MFSNAADKTGFMSYEGWNKSGVFITAPQLHGAPFQDPEELQSFKWGLECIVFLCDVMFEQDGICGG